MIAHLEGEFETVDFSENRCVLLYDNVESEDYPLHWHNAVEIILPLVNPIKANCEGTEYEVCERDILIIPAGTLHSLSTREGRRLILLADNRCFADNPALSDLRPMLDSPVFISHFEDRELSSQLCALLTEIYTLYSGWKDMAETYIYLKLLTLLVRVMEYRSGSGNEDAYNENFSAVLRYIEQNYTSPITLDELADKAGYSKYHFSRMFKKHCRTSFVNYLNRRRVRAAELLLVNEDISVTEAAMQVGFSSLSTFNRVFREYKNCTPTEFRRLYRIANSADG
ncbi:AraC-type DNA-binding protein [Ruminococcaceae bacterium FB2012]|nr:AraC-type DNA-binding protein [Ruminococcaceae bacterium FB2012]